MNDPWAFGWTQLLTLLGFAITVAIAISGFRTFGRWKREKLEEKKIEIALDALALAYESKYVFDNIRSPMAFEYEWKDMPIEDHESEEQRRQRGSYYAVARRITLNKEFFQRAFKMQPKFMAMFGKEAGHIFMLMHKPLRPPDAVSYHWVISARLCGARAYVFSRAAGNLLALRTPAT